MQIVKTYVYFRAPLHCSITDCRKRKVLKAAKSIRLEYDKGDTKYPYNRHLMHIFLDDKNFQEMMLKTGLVKIAYVFEPNTTYLKQLKKAEKYAKKNKLGLWSDKWNIAELGRGTIKIG